MIYMVLLDVEQVSYEEANLKEKSINLKLQFISIFKIGSKYTLKDIKGVIKDIYLKSNISKTPKASDLCNYFEVSEVKIYDSVLKKQNKGYLILGIK